MGIRRRRGVYLADPRKQGLAGKPTDNLFLFGNEYTPQRIHEAMSDGFQFNGKLHMCTINSEEYWKNDPDYFAARRVKYERNSTK